MKQVALLIMILFFMSSCTTVKEATPPPTTGINNSPELNKEVTTSVGNNITEKKITTMFYNPIRFTKFQQVLIFNGIVGNKLKIGYREFKDEMARPAFNNEVEYDLNTSKTIGYKGCQIEVIKADNESITYKVVKNFD